MAKLTQPEPLSPDVLREFEQIRSALKLRPLTAEENGAGVDDLPAGVYGFTYSPFEDNFPLFDDRDLRSYETHKLADGTAVVLGFVTPEEKERFETARDNVTIHLFPEPKEAADQLIRVPASRALGHVQYSQRYGKGLELEVGPKL